MSYNNSFHLLPLSLIYIHEGNSPLIFRIHRRKTMKILKHILYILAILFTFGAVCYVDNRVSELDNAVYQYMKDELNSKVEHKEDL